MRVLSLDDVAHIRDLLKPSPQLPSAKPESLKQKYLQPMHRRVPRNWGVFGTERQCTQA